MNSSFNSLSIFPIDSLHYETIEELYSGNKIKVEITHKIENPMKAFYLDFPEGIEIRPSKYGLGLFATKFFPKGTIILKCKFKIIYNIYDEFILVTKNQIYKLDTDMHSVEINTEERELYIVDSFINHSCNPNIGVYSQSIDSKENTYDMLALQDISSNYNNNFYDCKNLIVNVCHCASSYCVGHDKLALE